jgi:metallo-beta-lactamase class B
LSGATVVASPWSAAVLKSGGVSRDDPQYGDIRPIPPVKHVRILKDGETLHVGPIAITSHATPGHTRGGTSWTWQSCEGSRCLNMVYADSVSAMSAKGFKFTDNAAYPGGVQDFEKSITFLRATPCDILLTPHPEASDLWDRLQKRQAGNADAMIDPSACKRLADDAQAGLQERVASETGH